MRTKVTLTGAIALATMAITALFGVPGSGAAAEEMIPVLTTQEPAQQQQVRFVTEAVVQPLDETVVPNGAGEDFGETADSAADSLQELVADHDMPNALSREMNCLAGAVYFEARGESLEGRLAVARVIINRANSGRFPSNYCDVVFQPSQFSFVRGRSMPTIRKASQSWREAVAVAQIAVDNSWESEAKGALYFHATRVSPRWKLTRLARVDNHIFYR